MIGNRAHHKLSAIEIERILWLLKSTEMSGALIARRFGLSRSVIYLLNKRYKVRNFQLKPL